MSAYDISVTFAQNKEAEGKVVMEEQVMVFLSPHQFKALVTVAANTLEAYESLFGTLTLPPNFSARADLKEAVQKAYQKIEVSPSSSALPPPSRRSRAVLKK